MSLHLILSGRKRVLVFVSLSSSSDSLLLAPSILILTKGMRWNSRVTTICGTCKPLAAVLFIWIIFILVSLPFLCSLFSLFLSLVYTVGTNCEAHLSLNYVKCNFQLWQEKKRTEEKLNNFRIKTSRETLSNRLFYVVTYLAYQLRL